MNPSVSGPVITGRDAAFAQVEFLTGARNTPAYFRLIHDRDKRAPAQKLYGTLDAVWTAMRSAQAEGYGAFIVVNEGGNADAEISSIRAVFVDADGLPIPSLWHARPDFIVQRDETHWHAYWRASDLPVGRFREMQKRLAAHYGTDPAICNPSRVMRLAGSVHRKGAPLPVTLIDLTDGQPSCLLGRTEQELICGLPEISLPPTDRVTAPNAGVPFTSAELTRMLSFLDPDCGRDEWLRVAAAVHASPCSNDDFDKRDLFVRWSRGEVHRGA